jgi:hypothetical protein
LSADLLPCQVKEGWTEQQQSVEQAMPLVEARFKAIEQSYNRNVMQLVLARGYIAKLLANEAVARWLGRNQPEIRDEFRTIVAAASLDDTATLRRCVPCAAVVRQQGCEPVPLRPLIPIPSPYEPT